MRRPNPKYKVGQYFMHKSKNTLFRIIDSTYIKEIKKGSVSKVKSFQQNEINDWIYDIQYFRFEEGKEFGRYYEDRLINECEVVADQDLPKAIYE